MERPRSAAGASSAVSGSFCSQLRGREPHAERHEPARRDAAEQILAELPGADEHDRILLLRRRGKKRSRVIVSVAQSLSPVGRSTAVNCWYGVGVA
jgi:hypothetical protein